ncbi:MULTISPECIES: head completion/stabilization protein [unclassified Pseudodesulfovibrio]|uniref:head completion/stabilization protein n=1 Tax=unclassified Pseudodesulfovibrio TaxID=2661612 RepID=UPI000FEB9D51|nr:MULTISPECIES: head completion/stabilization protein [unclassified Pseudodesulfovibrio]MCJ2164650.1 head completion/stabilization protein [Pseudodesulfovibrio sp. S3-i]RWU04158.1 head protein [Pseudodesulfovibrio sp. S3]
MSFSGNATQESTTIVTNDGWWPNLSIAKFQESYRMPMEYPEGMLVDGLVLAMAWANKELAAWRSASDSETFEAVHNSKLNGESLLLVYYRKAVFCHAKAFLLQQYPTIDRREAASNEAKESAETEGKFLEYAQQAIADFLGVGRVTVELI